MNEPQEPMFADAFAEGGKVDNPHKWHAKPAEDCEHEWVAATINLEFVGGLTQQVPGHRCTKCRTQKFVIDGHSPEKAHETQA